MSLLIGAAKGLPFIGAIRSVKPSEINTGSVRTGGASPCGPNRGGSSQDAMLVVLPAKVIISKRPSTWAISS
jgi:hypothetical protein